MPSTPTPRNRLALQGTGDNVGSWGTVLNAQVFGLLDEALDGVTTLTVTGNANLSSQNYATDQARRRVLKLIGTPGASFTITLPSVEKFYLVHNATNAPQTVKAGGTGVTLPASSLAVVYCDGTNTFSPSVGLSAPVGCVMDFAGVTAPSGWLLCFGQAVSRTTYTALFQAIGTAYGVGDGSTTFNVPDCRGRARLGLDNMGGAAANRSSTVITSALGASGGHQLFQGHAHGNTATAATTTATTTGTTTTTISTASLGSMSAAGSASVTYPDWTTTITSISVAAGATQGLLVPATAGGDVSRSVFGQPVTVSLFGAPAVSSTSFSSSTSTSNSSTIVNVNNATAGTGTGQNMPPCLVFNTIIYAGT